MSEINWNQVRAEYKACDKNAYLMSAAVGALHRDVFNSKQKHIQDLYDIGDPYYMEAVERMDATRDKLGELLNCNAQGIGFCGNTSHGMNVLAMMMAQGSKRKIITTSDEFPSTCIPWEYHGFNLERVESKDNFIDYKKIIEAVDDDTAAVVCSAIQFGTGFRLNINKLGEELAMKGIPFIVNATQALGAFPVDVKAANISALTASCHKWMGAGYGVSVLYLKEDFKECFQWPMAGWLSVEDPMSMSNELSPLKKETSAVELGVPPFTVLAGLDAACEVILKLGIENIGRRIFEQSKVLETKLVAAGIKILSYRDNLEFEESANTGIISIEMDDPEAAEESLREKGIFVSARRGSIRLSVHYFNNESDFNRLLDIIG